MLLSTVTRRAAAAAFALCGLVAHAHDYQLGQITIAHPYARATADGQSSGGAFLSVKNAGADDRLIGVSADVAKDTQLHQMSMDGNVMRMRPVDAIAVKSGETVALKPGGYHVMLMGLRGPLKAGDSFPLTLKFEKAGEVKVDVHVEAAGAPAAMPHDMSHGKGM